MPDSLKKIIFVSTGRCGTRRIYELLTNILPNDIVVVHQMKYSRLANLLGTISMISDGKLNFSLFYEKLINPYIENKSAFISTDPLSAMIIPHQMVVSKETCIIHLERDSISFAQSMFNLSRSRPASFIAHNFVPFWQPGLYPLENLLNKNIKKKYARINAEKNSYLLKKYSHNQNYKKVAYDTVFKTDFLIHLLRSFLDENLSISNSDLQIRSNESRRKKSG